MDSQSLTTERYARETEATAAAYGLGATKAGLSLAEVYLSMTADIIRQLMDTNVTKETRGPPLVITTLQSDA